jgi:chaperonin GroES
MKFRPLQDKILVKRVESETRSAGGIIIPDAAQEKPKQAEIVAVGPGKRLSNGEVASLDVTTGDVIYFNQYAGIEVKLDGVDHLILKEDDILGVIEN